MQKCINNLQRVDYQPYYFYSTMNGRELRELRAKRKLSQDKLAEISGLSQPMISRIEATDDEIDSQSINSILSKIFNIEDKRGNNSTKNPKPNGIQIGELTEIEESSPFFDMGNGQYTMIVPIVPIKAQAGYIQHYNDEQYINEHFTEKHSFPVSRVYRGRYMAFIVDGDSMDNGVAGEAIPEGYTITGREIQKHLWKSKFHIHRYKDYIVVHQDGIYVKRITKHDTENGIITCHSLNPDYEDFDLMLDECLQIFNVVNVTQTR